MVTLQQINQRVSQLQNERKKTLQEVDRLLAESSTGNRSQIKSLVAKAKSLETFIQKTQRGEDVNVDRALQQSQRIQSLTEQKRNQSLKRKQQKQEAKRVSFEVSVSNDNILERRVETRRGQTRTTFFNRLTNNEITLNGRKTFSELSRSQRISLRNPTLPDKKEKVFLSGTAEDKKQKAFEFLQGELDKSSKSKVSGTIGPHQKSTITGNIRQSLTPKRTDRGFVRGLKGVGTFITENVISTISLASLVQHAILGDIKSQKEVLNLVKNTPTSIPIALSELGKQAQSSDPFDRTQAFLSIATLAIGVPITADTRILKIAHSSSNYKSKTNVNTGSTRIQIQSRGVTQSNELYSSIVKLRYSSKDKTIVGNVKTKIGDKTINKSVNLKEKNGFFQDVKTGEKIDRAIIPIDKVRYSIKEITIRKKKSDVSRTYEGNIITTGQRSVKSTLTKGTIENGKRVDVDKIRRAELDFVADIKGKPIDVKSVKRSVTANVNRKKTSKQKLLEQAKIASFLKAIRYNQILINGLDRRTRIARALGLRKDSKLLSRVEKKLEKESIAIKKQKGFIITETLIEEVNTQAFRLGFGRGDFDFKPLSELKKDELLRVPRTIIVPKLKARLKVVRFLRVRGFLPSRRASDIIKRIQDKIKDIEKKKIPDKIKEPLKKPKKIPIKKPKKAIVPIKKVTPRQKPIKKTSSKRRVPTKPRVPKIKIPRKPKKIKIPRFRFKLGNVQRRGIRNAYLIKVKKSGRILAESVQPLPLNRATNFAREIVDGKRGNYPLGASYDLVLSGKTNIVDVQRKVLGNKFRPKKSTNPKVLRAVEKRRYRLDTSAEKKAAQKAKLKTSPKKNIKRRPSSKKSTTIKRKNTKR